MQPIKPSEVVSVKPDVVIEVFNELIQKYWDGKYAIVPQKEAVDIIAARLYIDRETVFDQHYLDIEGVYQEVGWKVIYDKPGFNETPYPPTFTFSVKK